MHPNSATLLSAMQPDDPLHLDLGTTEEYYGIPYSVVPADQPLVPITYGTGGYDHSDESDPGPMPIPPSAPIEGGSGADPDPDSGDRHVLVLRQVILAAMQRYGLILADQGSAWYVTGTSHPGWEDVLAQLRARPVRGADFEVIQAGLLTAC